MVSIRKVGESGIYHVMVRGVAKCEIFKGEGDRGHYLNTLTSLREKHDIRMLAWCLMGNHVHLLPRVDRIDQLSSLMRDLNSDYSRYFNWKNDRVGHLFQSRFASKPVDDESYFMTVVRYIHQNPIGKYSKTCDYKWSSFWEYMGKRDSANTDIDEVLGLFGSRVEFARFHRAQRDPEGLLDPDKAGRLSGAEAHDLALSVVGEEMLPRLTSLPRGARDARIRQLHGYGLTIKQIANEVGLSNGTVGKICKSG